MSHVPLTISYGISTHSKFDFKPPARSLHETGKGLVNSTPAQSSTPMLSVSPPIWSKPHYLHRAVHYLLIDLYQSLSLSSPSECLHPSTLQEKQVFSWHRAGGEDIFRKMGRLTLKNMYAYVAGGREHVRRSQKGSISVLSLSCPWTLKQSCGYHEGLSPLLASKVICYLSVWLYFSATFNHKTKCRCEMWWNELASVFHHVCLISWIYLYKCVKVGIRIKVILS